MSFTAAGAGDYVVVARAAAHQTGGYRLGSRTDGAIVLRPYAGTTVSGTVTRQAGGPAANMTVRLTATTGGLSVTRSAVTNAQGEYSFTGALANAAVTVSLFDASGTVLAEKTGTTGSAGSTLDLPIVSPSLGSVEVRALIGTQPLPGLAVTVTSDNPHAAQGLRVQQGPTVADGRFVVTKAPAGSIVATAVDPVTGDPLQASGTLAEGATLTLELHVSQTGDTVAPAAVANLAATAVAPGTVRLAWTAPGDDGQTGTAAAYAIRYATSPITAGNFASATPLAAPAPAAAGSAQIIEATGLSSGATYYFALMTRDEAFNWSALSNVPSASPTLPGAGLKLWLRADAGVSTDGGSEYVTTWADQSGSGNHATQSAAAARPLRVQGEAERLARAALRREQRLRELHHAPDDRYVRSSG